MSATRETLEHLILRHGLDLGVAAILPIEEIEPVHDGDHLLVVCDHTHDEVEV
jgi:hypothetical protein